jgi:hypothetical protein
MNGYATWAIATVALLFLCILANTRERRAASLMTEEVYKSGNKNAIDLFRRLIAQPDSMNLFNNETIKLFYPLFQFMRFFYRLFSFSLSRVDTRTPEAFALYVSDKKIYELHDPDILRRYSEWRETVSTDWMSAALFFVVLMSITLRPLFQMLFE